MTKPVDQREKDLKSIGEWMVATAWSNSVSGVAKDLNAKIFLKSGNPGALSERYDKLQNQFMSSLDSKARSTDGLEAVNKELEKIDKEKEGLLKELTEIVEQEGASVAEPKSDEPQAMITAYENYLKAAQDEDKAQKAVFDRWMKLDARIIKVTSDAVAKAKKDLAAAQAALNSTNSQLNALEGEIRKVVGAYSNTATEMNRQDIASAVRSFLAIFAKA